MFDSSRGDDLPQRLRAFYNMADLPRHVGGGAFSDVYEVTRVTAEGPRRVAAKVVYDNFFMRALFGEAEEPFEDTVKAEYKRQVAFHRVAPEIVPAPYGVYNLDGPTPYIILEMELLEDARTLETYVRQESALPDLAPFMEAFNALLSAGLYHMDMHTENVVVSRGRVMMVDFAPINSPPSGEDNPLLRASMAWDFLGMALHLAVVEAFPHFLNLPKDGYRGYSFTRTLRNIQPYRAVLSGCLACEYTRRFPPPVRHMDSGSYNALLLTLAEDSPHYIYP